MLQRLARSQEQTVWFSLWDKVWDGDNLDQAILKVILNDGSAGVDGQTTQQLSQDWISEREQLKAQLRQGQYQPQPARRVWIPKPGTQEQRPLGVPCVGDRVVETALLHVLEPIFERDFAAQSYGFRPGRSCLHALERVESLLQSGHTWIVDVDLKSYFDTIPQDRLLELVQKRVQDGRILELLKAYLRAGIMEAGQDWQPTERGTPQGSVISPLLSNIYLNPLDHLMARQGYEMIRYADDLVACCRSEAQAQQALATLTAWVGQAGLKLHPTKTRIVNAALKGGFDFLGYHFERYQEGRGMKWPRQKSQKKLRDRLRELLPRGRSGSVSQILGEIKTILKGWYGYFKYSHPSAMQRVDEWVRERIRHILRRRQKRQGMVKGRERVEYPNRWFAEQGLFSLKNAQAQWMQSLAGTH
jgi:RNA-directed DNA polymerase